MFRQRLLTTSRRGNVVFRRQLTDSAGADSKFCQIERALGSLTRLISSGVRSRMVAELKVAMKVNLRRCMSITRIVPDHIIDS